MWRSTFCNALALTAALEEADSNPNVHDNARKCGSYLPPAGDLFYRNDMSSQDEFDEPSVICADAGEPGLLYAFIDEKLSARIAGSIAEIHRAHGHERFRGTDGKPLGLFQLKLRSRMRLSMGSKS